MADAAQRDSSGKASCPGCCSRDWSHSSGTQPNPLKAQSGKFLYCRPCDILWDPNQIETR